MELGHGSRDINAIMNELVMRVNDNTRRIRVAEERVRNLDRRTDSIEKTLIEENKGVNKELENVRVELKEARDRIANIGVDMINFKKELKKTVTARELREIQEYINLIMPITTKYVTKKEVEEMVK